MNERIRELARNADLNWHNHWNDDDSNSLKKFAELIVQDCIDIIAPYSVRMSRPGEEYLHPIQEIKQHFGVES